MFEELKYRFRSRNSNKNIKSELKKLQEQLSYLHKETIGHNRGGWVAFDVYGSKPEKDDSLYQKIEDLFDYLGIDYSETKLVLKPKKPVTTAAKTRRKPGRPRKNARAKEL